MTLPILHPDPANPDGASAKVVSGEVGLSETEPPEIITAGARTAITDFPHTDTGNAKTYAQMHGNDVRYDWRRGRWLRWDKHRWKLDDDGHVMRQAIAVSAELFRRAMAIRDEEQRKKALKWAMETQERRRLDAILAIARSLQPITDAGDKWELDP